MSLASELAWIMVSKGSLLLALAWLANQLLKRQPATTRHLVWALALAGVVLLPLSARWLPSLELPWLPRPATEAPSIALVDSDGVVRWTHQPSDVGPSTEAALGIGSARRASGWLVGWALVASVLLGRVVWGWRRLRQLEAESTPIDDERLRQWIAESGRRPRVRWRQHPEVATPCTWGVRRPVLLLPPMAVAWPDAMLRDVVTHELAHIDRRDWLLHQAARCVAALLWFQPLVWIALRGLDREAERACDDRVLATGGQATDYAERLLDFARAARRPAAAGLAIARTPDLAVRITAILDPAVPRHPTRRRHQAVAGLLLVAFSLTLGPSRLVRAEAARGTFEPAVTESPLLAAAARGDREWVDRLLAAGADPNQKVISEGSPLIVASRGGHLDVVQTLLDHGAVIDEPVLGDGNPLIRAAAAGHRDVVILLLDRGAEVDLLVPGDETALIQAAGAGHVDIAQWLIAHGADVDRQVEVERYDGRNEIRSPLAMAERGGHREVVDLLLQSGATAADVLIIEPNG